VKSMRCRRIPIARRTMKTPIRDCRAALLRLLLAPVDSFVVDRADQQIALKR
jgi:hypothetical protein